MEAVEVDGVSQYQFVLPDPDHIDKTIAIRNVTAGILVDFLSQFRDEQAMKEYLRQKKNPLRRRGNDINPSSTGTAR